MKKIFLLIVFLWIFLINSHLYAQSKLFPNFTPSKNQVVKYLDDPLLEKMQNTFLSSHQEKINKPLTRGEFLQFTLESAISDKNTLENQAEFHKFRDIFASHPLFNHITFAANNGIISGYTDGEFKPNNPISRAEATKILVNTLWLKLADRQTQFQDITEDNSLGIYIQTAYDNFLINGTSKKTFSPNKTISYGELIKILYNILHSGEAESTYIPSQKIETPKTETTKNPENQNISTENGLSFKKEIIQWIAFEYLFIEKNGKYKVITNASNSPKSLKNFVDELNGVAGINGAYFDAYKTMSTANTRIVAGDRKSFSAYDDDTGVNFIFGFDQNGDPLIAQNMIWWAKSPAFNYNKEKIDSLQYGIANFPGILFNGENLIPAYKKAGHITGKVAMKWDKWFICRTSNNDIKMGRVKSVTMEKLPDALLSLGCVDAVNMDAGGSFAMIYNWKHIYGPGRNIMDAFVVVKK